MTYDLRLRRDGFRHLDRLGDGAGDDGDDLAAGDQARRSGQDVHLEPTGDAWWKGRDDDGVVATVLHQLIAQGLDGIRITHARGEDVEALAFHAILGAGGASKAAVAALRNARKATVLSRREIPEASNYRSDLLINATPVGMFPYVDVSPVQGLIPANVVLDMVYNPPITRLLRSARDQGKTVIQGTTMFLAQAARQFEIWTGHRAPSEIFEEKTGLS